MLREASLRTDTATYLLSRNTVAQPGGPALSFWFRHDDETAELRLYPANATNPRPLRLRRSPDYQQLDTLSREADGGFRTRLRFQNLTSSRFLRLVVEQATDSAGRAPVQQVVPLLPLARTSVELRVTDNELFVGEEKVFELTSSNPRNVHASGEWVRSADFDYRLLAEANGTLRLHVLPNQLGAHPLVLRLQTERPTLGPGGRLSYQLPVLKQEFSVKASRLRFLSPDKHSLILNDNSRCKGGELILDNGRFFELRRTYCVEEQEEPGGELIGDLFVRQFLSNDRVLCLLRPYNTHRQTEYLYIKDADVARYLTNLDITPQAVIRNVQVLLNRLRPYKIGAGSVALNAFNLGSSSTGRFRRSNSGLGVPHAARGQVHVSAVFGRRVSAGHPEVVLHAGSGHRGAAVGASARRYL